MAPHITTAHEIWNEHIKKGDFVIDATCGNGHDTLFLAKTGKPSRILSIDIQEKALQNARLLCQNLPITFYLGSHAPLPALSQKPSLIVYNLGYLPGGDKTITTKTHSTLLSLQSAEQSIEKKGMISITLYPGHLEGAIESTAVLNWAETHTHFTLKKYVWSDNQKKPILLILKAN